MKDWTGQEYDEAALADPEGPRAQYDANLIGRLDPGVSLNISGPVGSQRAAARCQTGFVLAADATCEKCGAVGGEPCRSAAAGTAGRTAGNEPTAETMDPAVQEIDAIIQSMAPRR